MKYTIKNVAAGLLISVSLTGFSGPIAASTTAAEAIDAAIGAQKKAASVGGEWRDTSKMIKKAKALLAEGKTEEAKKLAEKAMQQGFLGYEQATAQSADNLHI